MVGSVDNPAVILLVEDEPADARLTQIALQKAKLHNVLHIVRDGEEALDFLHQRGNHVEAPRPDLVLLDLNLPRISGYGVLEEIRSSDFLSMIPVIVLTTSAAQRDIVESYKRNANCYISKPVGAEEFLAVVRSIEEFWLTIVKLPRPS